MKAWAVVCTLSLWLYQIHGVAVNTECLGDHSASFLEEPVPDEIKQVLDGGERAFGVNLIKSLFHDFNSTGIHKNIFISPASIYQTLILSYFGAQEQTQTDLAQTLGFEGKVERSDVIKNYLFERAFQAIRERDPNLGYTLTHANKFFFDRSLDLNQCLKLVLQNELEALDFSNPDKARSIINQWVAEKTNEKISKLLPQGALDSTKVALVNAAYFKGQWVSKFKSEDTKTNNFYVRRDKIAMTDFMEQKGKFNYYTSEELRAHVLEVPYIGEEVSMILILPPFEDDSLFETVSRLTPKNLQGVMAEVNSGFFAVDDLTVKIPKFKIEQEFELAQTLSKLGLDSLFGSPSNLKGFLSDEAQASEDINLARAIHKSFIEVNEEGSEAAAATALFEFRSARPLFHTEFIADHPFIFLIYDKPTDTILFFGMYQDPKM
eukprot:snap_masked-scaffold232_size243569-processed-gene-0.7 protein:Tk07012 transcript:snap_masked-scaffold232_size243569-processed-gene-0.7-mRNA-1 annotation:"serpin b4"